MSALKKQTALRWSCKSERSPRGAIFATVWSATSGRFKLEVTNFPGSRSLSWQIVIPGNDLWRTGQDVDRFEHSVATLKDFVFAKAQSLELEFRSGTV
jgi:hypothetical protein